MNLISCFGPLEGEFGLYSTLSNFVQTKNPLNEEICAAVQDGDEVGLLEVIIQVMDVAFVTLFEKNALARLQLVEKLPAEAIAEYFRVRESAVAATPPSVTTAAAPAPVAPPAPVDPLEQCAEDWKEMGSAQFKKKYMSDTRMRPYFDAAQERGLI